jgi:hypothetical protein
VEDFPLVHREDIVPFYFPCSICGVYSFHMVYAEPPGFGSEISFINSSPDASDRAHSLVCVKCTATNATLDLEEIENLAQNTIPRSIHARYPDLQTLYNPALFEQQKRRNLEKLSSENAEKIDCLVRHYRLES